MSQLKRIVIVLTFFLFITDVLLAQGALKGTVTDRNNGEPLYGANIIIVGTSIGTASDIEGKYRITQAPTGEVDVKFSYIGYEQQIIKVTIQNNKTVELDVELDFAIILGEEVQVTGQALGQVAAINQQLSSNTIINVVSEEKIQELPDANAAEALGRLPGVSLIRSGGEANKVILRGLSDKYLNVTVDGVRIPTTDALERGLDLSTISQSSLAGIELYKAITPDKDADAIAGTINLVTRKAPETRELRFVSKGGYNKIMDSFEQYDFSLKYGERFFDNFLGVQVNANIEQKIRSNEHTDIDYDQTGEDLKDYFINELNVEFTDELRTRKGLGLILDIDTPDDGNIKLSTMYSTTKRDYITHSRNYPGTEGSVTYSFRDREQEIDVYSGSLLGQNYLLGLDVRWGISYASSLADYPYDYETIFVEPNQTGVSGMRSGAGDIDPDHPEILPEFAYNNFRAATLNTAYYYTQDNSDDEFTTHLDLSRDYVLGNDISGTLKGGGKFRSKSRANENTMLYSPYYLGTWQPYTLLPDGSVVEKNFSGSYFEDFYNFYSQNPTNSAVSFQYFLDTTPESRFILDDFNVNPLIVRDKLRQWYDINKKGIGKSGSSKEYVNDPSAKANYYDITETVTSGYLMNTFHFGQFATVIVGARLEHESHDYNSKWSKIQTGGFPIPKDASRDTSSTYSETIVLPHLHINIKAADFMNIRLAAYRALARPDFNMRLPTYYAWSPADISGDNTLVIGNPILKTAKAWNFEINTSFYGNEIGLFSVSAFYKHIDDMYHMLNGISTKGNVLIESLGLDWKTLYRGNYELTVPYNSTEASKVWGFEVDHQINFTWLPGLLKNIVLSYNFSLVKSETTLIRSAIDTVYVEDPILGIPLPEYQVRATTQKQRLENQPEFFGNVSLGYDIGDFSGRLSLFHQSEYYRSYSSGGRGDIIVGDFTRLDLNLKYQLTDYLTLLCNVNNITNIKEEDFLENSVVGYKILRTMERYGLTMDFGVRVDL